MRGFLRLEATPTGFATGNVLTARLTVSLNDYRAPGSYGRYLDELERRLRQVPGVRSVGFIQYLPLQNFGWWGNLTIPSQGPAVLRTELRYVSPGYFEAMGIPLRGGRLLSDRDTAQAPTAIVVNETLARRYFPDGAAVGQRTDRGVIAGVVGDVRAERLDAPPGPEVYYAFAQNPAATSDAGVTLVLRASVPPLTLARYVTAAVREVNPNQVVYDLKTMDGVVAESLANSRLYVWLIACFAGVAMLLALAGVYGVISYVVSARTQEFGIRIALGAAPSRILGFVLSHAGRLVAAGLLTGVAGTLAGGRVLQSLIRGVNAADPVMLVGTAILLGAAGLAACLGPAQRATRVDPAVVLKGD
jgi:predicted permease